jgi:hypothetical protein
VLAYGAILDIDLEVDFPMRPTLLPGGGIAPNTGFPTFVRTSSSLLTNAADQLPDTWRDAFWQAQSQDHARFDEEHCRFMLYHLDGALRGDRDGYPPCAVLDPGLSCLDGGRSPGRLLGAGTCDCQPDDPLSYPGALERFDGIDNDCDGLIDEQVAVLPGAKEFPTTPSALADRLGPQVQTPEVKCIYRLHETNGRARAVVGAGPCPDYFPQGGPLQGVACEGLGPNLSDELCIRYVDDNEFLHPFIPDSDPFDVSPGDVRTFMVIWRATRTLAAGESVRILGNYHPDSTPQKGWSLFVNGGLSGSILGLTVNGDNIASAGFDPGNWDDGEWHVLGVTIDRRPSPTMTVFADTTGFGLNLTAFADIDPLLGVVLGSVGGTISMGEIAYYAVLDAGRGNVSNLLALIE